MQFMLCWKGPGYPVMKLVALDLSGTVLPEEVTFFTNTSKVFMHVTLKLHALYFS